MDGRTVQYIHDIVVDLSVIVSVNIRLRADSLLTYCVESGGAYLSNSKESYKQNLVYRILLRIRPWLQPDFNDSVEAWLNWRTPRAFKSRSSDAGGCFPTPCLQGNRTAFAAPRSDQLG